MTFARMHSHGPITFFCVVLAAGLSSAQEVSPAAKDVRPEIRAESPADIFQRAMQPVEIVRRSANNVTDSEIAAWGVAVVNAAHACAAHKIEEYGGEDLFHFARLCQLGQQYEAAAAAAKRYLKAGNTTSSESARALIVRAYLSAGNLLQAERGAYELLSNDAYDGTVHTMVQEVIMALAATDSIESSLQLVHRRAEALMTALRAGSGLPLHEGSYRVPPSVLVKDALEAVYLYRVENRIDNAPAGASSLIESVRQVVNDFSSSASPLERDAMQASLKRAQMLLRESPSLMVASSPAKPERPLPVLSYDEHITLLAFYAPWSPQRAQMFQLLASISRDYKTFPVQIFAVSTPMVATGDPNADLGKVMGRLMEQFGKDPIPVPLLVAPDSTNADFAVDDWPTFAVIDPRGIVRFLDTLTGPEYKDGGRMHRMIAALASQAGPVTPAPAKAKEKTGRVKVPEGTLQRRPK